ncbi:hypothetical protein MRX96_019902 [Rhipicephalus microplus]
MMQKEKEEITPAISRLAEAVVRNGGSIRAHLLIFIERTLLRYIMPSPYCVQTPQTVRRFRGARASREKREPHWCLLRRCSVWRACGRPSVAKRGRVALTGASAPCVSAARTCVTTSSSHLRLEERARRITTTQPIPVRAKRRQPLLPCVQRTAPTFPHVTASRTREPHLKSASRSSLIGTSRTPLSSSSLLDALLPVGTGVTSEVGRKLADRDPLARVNVSSALNNYSATVREAVPVWGPFSVREASSADALWRKPRQEGTRVGRWGGEPLYSHCSSFTHSTPWPKPPPCSRSLEPHLFHRYTFHH